jgi:hypothetical protein
MDSTVHREFERLIRIAFTAETQFNRNAPRGRFYQVEQRVFGLQTLNRGWRIWADGAVGFVESITRRGSPGEWIGDVTFDLLRFLLLGVLCFDKWTLTGPVIVFHILSIGPTKFLPNFPLPSNPDRFHEVPGIHFPDAPRPSVVQSQLYQETDISALQDPREMTAEILLSQFQEVAGASIRFDDLLFAVRRVFADAGLHRFRQN